MALAVGDTVEVQGSGAKPYKIKNHDGIIYSCSCFFAMLMTLVGCDADRPAQEKAHACAPTKATSVETAKPLKPLRFWVEVGTSLRNGKPDDTPLQTVTASPTTSVIVPTAMVGWTCKTTAFSQDMDISNETAMIAFVDGHGKMPMTDFYGMGVNCSGPHGNIGVGVRCISIKESHDESQVVVGDAHGTIVVLSLFCANVELE